MGQRADCHAKLGSDSAKGVAELETDYVSFRSPMLKFKFTFADLKTVQVSGGALQLEYREGLASLELGAKAAARWADKILNPPSRLDKLGIKPQHTLLLDGAFEKSFLAEVKRNGMADLKTCDFVMLAASTRDGLETVASIAKRMRRDAALWIVYPKGVEQIREGDVIAAGRAAGLKDVKVMRFSERDTALKFVVPLKERGLVSETSNRCLRITTQHPY